MKAQIIEAITEAEKQAAYEKESAVAQAELLQREAEVRAKNTITASAGVFGNADSAGDGAKRKTLRRRDRKSGKICR